MNLDSAPGPLRRGKSCCRQGDGSQRAPTPAKGSVSSWVRQGVHECLGGTAAGDLGHGDTGCRAQRLHPQPGERHLESPAWPVGLAGTPASLQQQSSRRCLREFMWGIIFPFVWAIVPAQPSVPQHRATPHSANVSRASCSDHLSSHMKKQA